MTDLQKCENAINGSCPRCSPCLPRICCDLCNPEVFKDTFQVPDAGLKPQPRRSKIKDYHPTESDKSFRTWLDGWRQKTSEDDYGKGCSTHFGSSNIMTDTIFERICDAAHHNLINTIDDLYKETRWHLTHKYGQIVVNVVKDVIPVALPPPKPHTEKTLRKCSSCRQVGHTSESSMARLPYLCLVNSWLAERSIQCPNYSQCLAKQAAGSSRTTETVYPANVMNVSFCVEPTQSDPGPSQPTAHYSRIKLRNVTNGE